MPPISGPRVRQATQRIRWRIAHSLPSGLCAGTTRSVPRAITAAIPSTRVSSARHHEPRTMRPGKAGREANKIAITGIHTSTQASMSQSGPCWATVTWVRSSRSSGNCWYTSVSEPTVKNRNCKVRARLSARRLRLLAAPAQISSSTAPRKEAPTGIPIK